MFGQEEGPAIRPAQVSGTRAHTHIHDLAQTVSSECCTNLNMILVGHIDNLVCSLFLTLILSPSMWSPDSGPKLLKEMGLQEDVTDGPCLPRGVQAAV